jgi:hypothetical protein
MFYKFKQLTRSLLTTGVRRKARRLMISPENQIPIVFQNWNDEYDWWHPNTVPLDFRINGAKKLPATHEGMWFDIGTIPSGEVQHNKWLASNAIKREILSSTQEVKFTKYSDIGDRKYIFPVFMPATTYFKKHQSISFKYVDTRILEDIRNRKAVMTLMCPSEGLSGTEGPYADDFKILNQWCLDNKLPKEGVYYLHGNLKAKTYLSDYNFTYIEMDTFPGWITQPQPSIVEFNPTSDKNLFLCYNRRPHYHRIITVCELMKNNLTDRGIYSLSNTGLKIRCTLETTKRLDLIMYGMMLDTQLPIELDLDLATNNPANVIVPEHFEKTFISIITETLTSDKTIFFSEKIYKPIAMGHPFMVVSSIGFLAELRQRGYKTFGQWIDESYDLMPNLHDRISAIIKETVRLSKLSVDELKAIREEMKPVLQHNQDLFAEIKRTQFDNGWSDTHTYKEIKKIWDNFK